MTDELIALLRELRPNYGDVGSRDVDVAEKQHKIDRALELLSVSKPAATQTLSDGAQYFACYLIDNCENEVVREESVQAWLGKMLASPRYHPAAPAQSGEAIYQLVQINGSWLDVSKDAYDSTEEERRRIVYATPQPSIKPGADHE